MARHGRYHGGEDVAYPEPEQFAAPGPYLADLAIKYLEENGTLPDPELTFELLQQYWDAVSRERGPEQPAARPNDHRLFQMVQPEQPIVEQIQARGAFKPDGALQFAERRLHLVPFLGLSPAEIHGGPLSVCQASPQPVVDVDASPSMSSSSAGSEPGTEVGATKPTRPSTSSKDLWLPGEIELATQLRDIQRKTWPEIREILGRHTDLSITDKYYSEKRKAKGQR